jgi:hypothetical protein
MFAGHNDIHNGDIQGTQSIPFFRQRHNADEYKQLKPNVRRHTPHFQWNCVPCGKGKHEYQKRRTQLRKECHLNCSAQKRWKAWVLGGGIKI